MSDWKTKLPREKPPKETCYLENLINYLKENGEI